MAVYGPVIQNEAAYAAGAKRNILANARKTFLRTYEDAQAIEDLIAAGRSYDDFGSPSGYKDSFIGAMARAYDSFGKLSPKQVDACRKIIAGRAARKAEWAAKDAELNATRRWLGEVGQKIVVELTLKKVIEIERQKFSYYDSGVSYLLILEDAERNVVIYKGTAAALNIAEGESVKIQAVIKECGVRDGVKQTVIQRPKLAA